LSGAITWVPLFSVQIANWLGMPPVLAPGW
jgi:hypothetical protein